MSGLNEELQRRISSALDAGDVDADEELAAMLADDEEAALYAADLAAIDEALGGLRFDPADEEPDWDAMVARIDERLEAEEALDDIGDPTAPPDLAPEPEPETAPQADAEPEEPHAPVMAASAAAPEPSRGAVVSLAEERRKRRRLITAVGGLAAAAAVGLGITAGLTMGADEPAAEMAASPVSQEAAPVVAAADQAAEADMEMPAAQPMPPADDQAPAEGWTNALAEASEPEEEELPAAAAATPGSSREARTRGRAPTRAADDVLLDGLGRGGGGAGGGAAPSPEPARALRRRTSRGRRSGGGARTASSSSGPTQPPLDRVAAVQALRAVQPQVRRCMGERREVARVRVTVEGPTGRITDVSVEEPSDGPEVSCVARVVRTARMPRASQPRYSTGFAYRPAPVAGGSMTGSGTSARQHRRPANPMESLDETTEAR